MNDLVSGAFGQLGEWINEALGILLSFLPDSPFQMLTQDETIAKYIGWVNWVIPLDFMVSVLEVWLTAVALFYVWQIALRWIKAIE